MFWPREQPFEDYCCLKDSEFAWQIRFQRPSLVLSLSRAHARIRPSTTAISACPALSLRDLLSFYHLLHQLQVFLTVLSQVCFDDQVFVSPKEASIWFQHRIRVKVKWSLDMRVFMPSRQTSGNFWGKGKISRLSPGFRPRKQRPSLTSGSNTTE